MLPYVTTVIVAPWKVAGLASLLANQALSPIVPGILRRSDVEE